MLNLRAVIVDDDEDYRRKVRDKLEEAEFSPDMVFDTDNCNKARDYNFDAALIVLDSLGSDNVSYWRELLVPLRIRHPSAVFLLVSHFNDPDVIKGIGGDKQTERLLDTDPLMFFQPKPVKDSSEVEDVWDKRREDHFVAIKAFARRIVDDTRARRDLEKMLLECALSAGRKIISTPLGKLIPGTIASPEKVNGTYGMDVITEKEIELFFSSVVHRYDVLICTEERGAHNEKHHRILTPRFFVFSDPLDGSRQLKNFASCVSEDATNNPKGFDATMLDITRNESLMEKWEGNYGYRSMNSPMVSIVLAERHRVVANVLLNLFTYDVFMSVESGNYWRNCPKFESPLEHDVVLDAISSGDKIQENMGWSRIEFRTFESLSEGKKDKENDRLFLCTMQASKIRGLKPQCCYEHVVGCLEESIIPRSFNRSESFRLRAMQNDFTPGPGRILFMMESQALLKHEEKQLSSRAYGCILSAGEPLTEWVGWLAFLRHGRGKVSAYCLRRRDGKNKPCTHKFHDNDPSPLLPQQVNSIFQDGRTDLLLLPAAYGRSMRDYHDTIVVAYDDDPDWKEILKPINDEDVYVKIHLF